jgi:hypothetical protein
VNTVQGRSQIPKLQTYPAAHWSELVHVVRQVPPVALQVYGSHATGGESTQLPAPLQKSRGSSVFASAQVGAAQTVVAE